MSDAAPTSERQPRPERRGALAWMARNTVAANLLMLALLVGGLLFASRVRQEVFPEVDVDVITVNVAYPGASPEEVEQGVTLAIEEGVRGIDGVKAVTSTSAEGAVSVAIELEIGTSRERALGDVKSAVDRITSFPKDAERPLVSLVEFRGQVIALVVHGDASEKALRAVADKVREDLLQDPRISRVELASVRPLEIGIEVPRDKLRAYGLTLEQVAAAVRTANVELPAGGIKTERGEILLRTSERRDYGREFGDIVVVSRPDGTVVRLGELARIEDAFRDTDQQAFFDGKPAAMVRVYRTGDEKPLDIADAVHEYLAKRSGELPPGVRVAVWDDRSEMYRGRIDLLLANAYQGLVLVILFLGLLLEFRLAFWVTLGIPTSFLGALLFLPAFDVSVNMISLFAFIITTGIVVDDAIVISEQIHFRRQQGMPPIQAAIAGLYDVVTPVTFAVLTTLASFTPLLFVPGTTGKFFRNIPVVVILVLAVSLVESLFVLPAHLGAHKEGGGWARALGVRLFGERLGPFGWLHRAQQAFSRRFEQLVYGRFQPVVAAVIRNRYLSIAVALALLVFTAGWVAGGRIAFTFFPRIEADVVFAQLEMPFGTPVDATRAHMDRMVTAAREVVAEAGGEAENVRGIFSQVGLASFGGMGRGARGAVSSAGSHVAEVAVAMRPLGERRISAREMAEKWRRKVGAIPGADSLRFTFTTGTGAEAPISVQLSHADVRTLGLAAADLAQQLRSFAGVKDVDDGVALGKPQLDFELTPEARALGITETELARQVRSAFFGAEASRQQRGRDEVRSYVRLPRAERASLHDLDELIVRTPGGGEIPLAVAADVRWGRAYTGIRREDGRRVITVEADVEQGKANPNKVMAELDGEAIPALLRRYPGLAHHPAGEQKRQAETLGALGKGFQLALLAIFAMMAIPLKSYWQPLAIMMAIPFGFVGAIWSHVLLGYELSIMSMMGLVALSGMAVNDSLVLIDAYNAFRAEGLSVFDAAVAASARRFRPVLLTSGTTFLGLVPMIFSTSLQARFLVPMAISLGCGVLFSTAVALLLVPCLCLVMQDFGRLAARLVGRSQRSALSGQPSAVGARSES